MDHLKLKHICLLAVSGELSPALRRDLDVHLLKNPADAHDYQALADHYQFLQTLPLPEPSALERRHIPAGIKQVLHLALRRQERVKQATRRRSLVQGAATVAAAVLLVGCVAVLACASHALSVPKAAGPGDSAALAKNSGGSPDPAPAADFATASLPDFTTDDDQSDHYFVADVSNPHGAPAVTVDDTESPLCD